MSQEITDANFNSIIRTNKVVVVDFSATWCGPCRALAPMVDQLSSEFQGKAIVGKLDVDKSPATTAQFGIRNIPAILFFKNGNLVHKEGAGVTKSILADRIKSLL